MSWRNAPSAAGVALIWVGLEMVEYIKREDALSFPFVNGQYDHKNADEHFINGCETYREWLEQIPAADVRPVVRCINCKYYEGLACCKLIGDCGGTNWFCGWGEPKEET